MVISSCGVGYSYVYQGTYDCIDLQMHACRPRCIWKRTWMLANVFLFIGSPSNRLSGNSFLFQNGLSKCKTISCASLLKFRLMCAHFQVQALWHSFIQYSCVCATMPKAELTQPRRSLTDGELVAAFQGSSFILFLFFVCAWPPLGGRDHFLTTNPSPPSEQNQWRWPLTATYVAP